MVWCFSSIFHILWVYAPVILIFSFEVLRFPPTLFVFWLFQKVRVTWLIKIQVKNNNFSLLHFHILCSFRLWYWLWMATKNTVITFLAGPAFAWNLFYISINFHGVIFILFFISLLILGFCTELYVFIYSRRKSFWLKLCPTLKVFLMIDACAHKEHAN